MNDYLSRLHNIVEEKNANICQICAFKDGIMKYNESFHGFKETDTLQVMSVTKTVTALLVGICIDQGLIKSEEDLVIDYFPDYKIIKGEKTIKEVKIKHLLTMTAPYKYRSEPWKKVCTSFDWVKAVLDLLGGRKGITGEFKYATLGIQILMGIIANVTKMKTIDFANKNLFEPLGIPVHINNEDETAEGQFEFFMCKHSMGNKWYSGPEGTNTAGWGLCLSAIDLCKIGQMLLNNGFYDGKKIISETWIKKMTTPYYDCDEMFGNMSYGYLCWIINKKEEAFAAIGDGGNVIYVNPKTRVVVGITATFKPRVFDRVQFIQDYIEPFI